MSEPSSKPEEDKIQFSPLLSDTAFIRQYSFKFEVLGKNLRIFYKKHALGDEVPLIMFLHGFGGTLDHFKEQLRYFGNIAHVLAMDLVYHGQSDVPSPLSRYSTVSSMLDDIYYVFKMHQARNNVIMAHAYGCSLATKLYPRIQDAIRAMIFIGVNSNEPPLSKDVAWIVHTPVHILQARPFNHHWLAIRSLYAYRFISKSHKTIAWNRRIERFIHTLGILISFMRILLRNMVWAREEEFRKIATPLLLLTGENDLITPPDNMESILSWCGSYCRKPQIVPRAGHYVMLERELILNAMVNRFLIDDVQLAELDPKRELLRSKSARDFKWSMKNLEKWSDTSCVGERVRGTFFRPMKTMRQTDANHSPRECLRRHPQVELIMDVSSAEPPYDITDPAIKRYYKLPTESKTVPSIERCRDFIRAADEFWKEQTDREIGVHCHYGFNRTGFLICSYLIERRGLSVKEALKRFAEARPPGIKHQHFRDELALRYAEAI